MILIRLLLPFFCFISVTPVLAQFRLAGTLTNPTHTPIPFATVVAKNSANGAERMASTDSAGNFAFLNLAAGNYALSITGLGYAPVQWQVELRRDTLLSIVLQTQASQLSEVAVMGNKPTVTASANGLVYNVGSSITASGGDALQAISQLPGVRVNNNEISIAGKGQTRVMINNRLIQLQGEDLIRYLKSFSANQVARIELIHNPSARYEVDGNAGLINIITRHSKLKGYSGNLQLASKYYAPGESSVYGYKNFGELNGSANLAYNWNRWSIYGSLNHVRDLHLEGFQVDLYYPKQHWMQTDTGLYTHQVVTALAGVDYKVSDALTVGLSFTGGRDVYDGFDRVRNPIYNASGSLDSLLRTYAHYHPVALPAAWNLYASLKLDTAGRQLLLNADYFNYYRNDVSDFESNSYDDKGNNQPEGRTLIFDRNKQNIVIYTLKADLDWPTRFANFSFGGKLSFISEYSNAFYYNKTGGGLVYNPNLSNEFDYTENTQALYGSMSKEVSKWKLQAGLRAERTKNKGYSYTVQQTTVNQYIKLFPSIQASYTASADHQFSLSIGRRINRPSFWSLNPFKSLYTAYSYGEGNPYLQPEYTYNGELTHAYRSVLRTTIFANSTDNGFVNVTMVHPDTNLVYTRPFNFIQTTRVGISETISWTPFSWWETSAMLSFYYTRAHSALPEIQSLQGTGAYLASSNKIYFNRSKTLAAAVNAWYQFPEVDHISRTYRYYKLDLGLKATTPNKKWDLALNLNDVTRSSAMAYRYTVNGIPQTFTNFQIIRYWQLSITYRFGKGQEAGSSRSSGNEEERGRVH